MNPLVRLGALGQSPWYDFITRDLLDSGDLTRLIAEDGLLGMTSNPTIFEKAVAGSALYDADIRAASREGVTPSDITERLMVTDVRTACDHFRAVYERTEGRDGFVSLEVSPELAHQTEETLAAAKRLWAAVDRPNAMIKIPGTVAGLGAIEAALAHGININVTLLFSVTRYESVLEAWLAGLERRLAHGEPVDRIASVASFFVSRVDSAVDAQIAAGGLPDALRGTAAIANAANAYASFERVVASSRWRDLAAAGARVQRPLWASTSTKDPAYPDTYYVEALVGRDTVNTLPPATFEAYRDHGDPALRLPGAVSRAPEQLAVLSSHGIDLERVASSLEEAGVKSFADSYRSLVAGVETKASTLVS